MKVTETFILSDEVLAPVLLVLLTLNKQPEVWSVAHFKKNGRKITNKSICGFLSAQVNFSWFDLTNYISITHKNVQIEMMKINFFNLNMAI